MMLHINMTALAVFGLKESQALVFDLAIKGMLLLAATTLLSRILRKNSAAAKHRLWSLTMIGLLILPCFSSLLPGVWTLMVPTDIAPYVPTIPSSTPAVQFIADSRHTTEFADDPAPGPRDPLGEPATTGTAVDISSTLPTGRPSRADGTTLGWELVPVVWACGALVLLLRLAIGTWRVAHFNAAASPVVDPAWRSLIEELRQRLELKRPVELREHPGSFVPVTLGIFRPVVVVPHQAREWSGSLKQMVLLHELAHIQRHDVAFQWIARVACAIYWFNPLVWWGLRQLRLEREHACDDLVIHCGERATDYADGLLTVARTFQDDRGLACAVAMTRRGMLEGRLRSLLDADFARSHAPLGRIIACLMLIVMTAMTATVSAIRLAAQPSGVPELPTVEFDTDEPIPGLTQRRKTNVLEHSVTVIAMDGRPVVGASVFPWGFGTTNGTGWGWFPTWPKEFKTNAEGIAKILVPEELMAAVPPESGEVWFLSFRIEHPDYAPAARSQRQITDRQSITLSDGVVIAPKVTDGATGGTISADLFAVSSGYPSLKWSVASGELRSARMDPTDAERGQYFRVIHAPQGSDSQIQFSDVIDVTTIITQEGHLKNGTQRAGIADVDVSVHPGVRLSGKLSGNVPRPVKNGHVIASILAGPSQSGLVWQDVASLSETGTFEFASLPRNSHVELVAVCDGWVSTTLPADAAEYDRRFGTNFLQQARIDRTISAMPVRLENGTVTTTLNMVPTGTCEFTIQDATGNPLDLATITCLPYHMTRSGTFRLGEGGRSLDEVRNAQPTELPKWNRRLVNFCRVTNPHGRAVISNLPTGSLMVQVECPGYTIVPDSRYAAAAIGVADIQPGVMSRATLTLRKTEDDRNLPRIQPPDADGVSLYPIQIISPDGAPVHQARIKLVGQSILNMNNQQPWPDDWPHVVTTDEYGMAGIPLRLPETVTPEILAKASIWFDLEHPEHAPIKNINRSLTNGLPIRMTRDTE